MIAAAIKRAINNALNSDTRLAMVGKSEWIRGAFVKTVTLSPVRQPAVRNEAPVFLLKEDWIMAKKKAAKKAVKKATKKVAKKKAAKKK